MQKINIIKLRKKFRGYNDKNIINKVALLVNLKDHKFCERSIPSLLLS